MLKRCSAGPAGVGNLDRALTNSLGAQDSSIAEEAIGCGCKWVCQAIGCGCKWVYQVRYSAEEWELRNQQLCRRIDCQWVDKVQYPAEEWELMGQLERKKAIGYKLAYNVNLLSKCSDRSRRST
eukprot:SM000081S22626  [mRNA]  locus=s81:132385:132913:- [translate_table: standard]